ncbi:MAG: type II toxin-antitoxin system PemK/MazF family toxin [Anaerolineae bacterium]|nr:type II toxin-antitoxin system PemK/MazF family toxin [Anaerolineae bacterium]
MPPSNIQRGDVWLVRFDPSEGDEIRKTRPAVIMTAVSAGRIALHIVVPVTAWQPSFVNYSFIVRLTPSLQNGLTKESGANAFQVESVATSRFQTRLGNLTYEEIEELAAAVALCVGYQP